VNITQNIYFTEDYLIERCTSYVRSIEDNSLLK